MKKLIICLLSILLPAISIQSNLKANPAPEKTQTIQQLEESKILINGLEEIKTIDKSTLSRTERRALRKEVRSIDSRLRAIGGGIYISAGALIIILILLLVL